MAEKNLVTNPDAVKPINASEIKPVNKNATESGDDNAIEERYLFDLFQNLEKAEESQDEAAQLKAFQALQNYYISQETMGDKAAVVGSSINKGINKGISVGIGLPVDIVNLILGVGEKGLRNIMNEIGFEVSPDNKIISDEPFLGGEQITPDIIPLGLEKSDITPVTQTAPVTTAAPTGIQTIPSEKKSFNVMMNEQGNVMKDQSMAELARETGIAPYIQNYPINSMSDVMRMIGPGESIAEGTDYNMPPSVEQRMQAAADKGLDARMGRTYAENIQAMADPRMRSQMPMNIMPPMSNEFATDPGYFSNPNVSAGNPGGYASEQEAIADLGIEKYNTMYNRGGRVSLSNGGLANILGV